MSPPEAPSRKIGAPLANPRSRRSAPYVLSGADVRDEVVRRVMSQVLEHAAARGPDLEEMVHESLYDEQRRLARAPADARSDADRRFTDELRRELARATPSHRRELVHTLVARYADEIAGHFDRRVYGLATGVLPAALSVLLHRPDTPSSKLFDFDDRILIEGAVDQLGALMQRGTVMLAPTHVSNLDSLVLGAAIHRLGLPPLAYAAGLNLFGNKLVGYFMQHLGAYTVDRKKTDPLYRQTLKEYAGLLLERGQHSLVFPGGTRSRSGQLESHLKKGLLGTAPAAFRRALSACAPRPRIFVVPCTLSYPLVLEAATLIEEYLREEGGARYIDVRDEFDSPRRWFDFLGGLRQLDVQVHVRFSQGLDWLGNPVDPEGNSHDARGRHIDVARYLIADGELVEDEARDAEYTRLLASGVLEAYRRDNVALPTSLVAFAVFERLRRLRREPSLFRFLRSLAPEPSVALPDLLGDVTRGAAELRRLEARGQIACSRQIESEPPERLVERALSTFATYHRTPVLQRRDAEVHVLDANLLLYYRNRLTGYGLLDSACSARATGSGP